MASVAGLSGLLVLCLLAAGCVSPESEMGPVTLEIELDSATLAPGAWVNVTVRLENHGDTPFRYEHPGCPPEPFRIEVRAPEGTVELYRYGEEPLFGACAVRPTAVAAGEQMEWTVQWNGYTQGAAPDPHTGPRVAPGAVTVHAWLARSDGGDKLPAQVDLTVL